MNPIPSSNDLHASYTLLTGLAIPLTMARMYCWENWCVADRKGDFRTKAELEQVIRYVKRTKGQFSKTMLRFERLVRNTEYFDELKAESEQDQRVRVALADPARRPRMDPGKAQVVRAAGRSDALPASAEKSVSQVLAISRDEALAKLREFRENL